VAHLLYTTVIVIASIKIKCMYVLC